MCEVLSQTDPNEGAKYRGKFGVITKPHVLKMVIKERKLLSCFDVVCRPCALARRSYVLGKNGSCYGDFHVR